MPRSSFQSNKTWALAPYWRHLGTDRASKVPLNPIGPHQRVNATLRSQTANRWIQIKPNPGPSVGTLAGHPQTEGSQSKLNPSHNILTKPWAALRVGSGWRWWWQPTSELFNPPQSSTTTTDWLHKTQIKQFTNDSWLPTNNAVPQPPPAKEVDDSPSDR